VHQWLRAQPKTFYYDGIKQLVGRWEKCDERQGDCVEQLCILFLLSINWSYKIKSAETF
jgi:hypothetical protein